MLGPSPEEAGAEQEQIMVSVDGQRRWHPSQVEAAGRLLQQKEDGYGVAFHSLQLEELHASKCQKSKSNLLIAPGFKVMSRNIRLSACPLTK